MLEILRHRLRRLSWIALLAIFGLAFAPAISHALAHGGGSAWTEVCTPRGMKLVALDETGAADPTPTLAGSSHLEHCPLCALGVMAPPPVPTAAPLRMDGAAHAVPRLFLQAPRTLFVWAAPPLRGPPNVS